MESELVSQKFFFNFNKKKSIITLYICNSSSTYSNVPNDKFLVYNISLTVDLKGQLISKCLFGVIVFDQKNNKIILRISALASKKRSNQKKSLSNQIFLSNEVP